MAAAMTARMTPPATIELTRFFNVGVTPAWATRGLAIAAPTPATTPAEIASFLDALHNLSAQYYNHSSAQNYDNELDLVYQYWSSLMLGKHESTSALF